VVAEDLTGQRRAHLGGGSGGLQPREIAVTGPIKTHLIACNSKQHPLLAWHKPSPSGCFSVDAAAKRMPGRGISIPRSCDGLPGPFSARVDSAIFTSMKRVRQFVYGLAIPVPIAFPNVPPAATV
jgi:hypothetical protein